MDEGPNKRIRTATGRLTKGKETVGMLELLFELHSPIHIGNDFAFGPSIRHTKKYEAFDE